MVQAGYDDVDDFKNLDRTSLQRMRAALTKQAVPDGHVDKIARHMKGRSSAMVPPPSAESRQTEMQSRQAEMQQQTSTPTAPTPIQIDRVYVGGSRETARLLGCGPACRGEYRKLSPTN